MARSTIDDEVNEEEHILDVDVTEEEMDGDQHVMVLSPRVGRPGRSERPTPEGGGQEETEGLDAPKRAAIRPAAGFLQNLPEWARA